MLEDTTKELFDEVFFQWLSDLIDTAVTRRQQKRRAVEVFKMARTPLKGSSA